VEGKKYVKPRATTNEAKKKANIINDKFGFEALSNLSKQTHLFAN
jgi:hypothetical protein